MFTIIVVVLMGSVVYDCDCWYKNFEVGEIKLSYCLLV